jgi:hypothetical protein
VGGQAAVALNFFKSEIKKSNRAGRGTGGNPYHPSPRPVVPRPQLDRVDGRDSHHCFSVPHEAENSIIGIAFSGRWRFRLAFHFQIERQLQLLRLPHQPQA